MPSFTGVASPENNFSQYTASSIKTAEERRQAVIKNEKVLEAIDRRITSRGPDPPMSELVKEPTSAFDLASRLLQACDEGDTELIECLLHKGADPNLIVDQSMYQSEGDDLSPRRRKKMSPGGSTSIIVGSAVDIIVPPESSPITSAGASTSNNTFGLHLKVPPNNYFRQSPSPLSQSPKSRSASNSNSRSVSRPSTPPNDPTSLSNPQQASKGANGRRGSSSFSSGILPAQSVVKAKKEDNIPLLRACYSGRTAAVIALLEAGTDANKTLSETGDITPLRIAVAKGIPLMIEALVSIGKAMVNAPNAAGRTPLHFACELGDAKCCEILAKMGASRSLRDNFGNIPEQLVPPDCPEHSDIQRALSLAA